MTDADETPAPPPARPDIAAIRERAEQATRGPWRGGQHDGDLAAFVAKSLAKRDADRLYLVFVGDDPDDCLMVAVTGNGPTSEANMWFIADARTDVPALLAYIDRLEAAGAALDKALGDYVHRRMDSRLVAWKRVAKCRAAWRAAVEGQHEQG